MPFIVDTQGVRFIFLSALFRTRKVILILSVFASLVGHSMYAQSETQKRVLYINSYHRGYLWSDYVEHGIREGLGRDVDVTTAYLDAKRSDVDRLMPLNLALIQAKLDEKPVDLIITSDNAAFDFVLQNREDFLEGIPLVACGLNYLTAEDLAPYSNLVGIAEIGDPFANIELGLELFPDTKELILLSDLAFANSDEVIDQIYKTYEDRYEIRVVLTTSDHSTESIIEDINSTNLPKIIVNYGISPASGLNVQAYNARDSDISQVPYPIFVAFEGTIVGDVFGGLCQDADGHGRMTAQIAKDIFNGKDPDEIPHVLENVEKLVFNYNALRKFHLKPSQLPEGAIIVNTPEKKYVVIRRYLIVALVVIAALSIVLTALLYEVFRRKKAERSLVVALKKVDEASKAKSNFMMMMSHELLTPLNAIIGFSSLIEDERDEEIKRAHLRDIQIHSNLLLKLIKQILEFTNFDSTTADIGVCKIKSLVKKLEQTHQASMEDKSLQFVSSISNRQKLYPALNCEILKIVLDQLIENAVKFSDRGSVTLDVSFPERLVRRRGLLKISVSDEGMGLSPDDIPHIFEPFHQIDGSITRRHGGVGLGLATCKKLIDSIDGTISCKSELGKGSTFTIVLPCYFVRKRKGKKSKELIDEFLV